MKKEWGGFLNHGFFQGIVVSTLSLLSVVLIPLTGAFVIVLMPLPVLFYYAKLGRFRGLAVFAVSLALVLLILGLIHPNITSPLLMLVLVGGTGIVIGEVLKRQATVEKTLMIPVAVLLACCGSLLLLYGYQTAQRPLGLIEKYILVSILESIKLYEHMDISSEQLALIREQAGPIAALLARIFPAMCVVGAGLFVWLNLMSARYLFSRHGLHYPDFGDLTRWKPPDRLVWLLIGAGGALLLEPAVFKYSGLNLLILCLFVYLCAGLAVVGYFFKVKKVPLFIKILFYVLIIIQQYLLVFVTALGLFDLWADFRKRIKPARNAGV